MAKLLVRRQSAKATFAAKALECKANAKVVRRFDGSPVWARLGQLTFELLEQEASRAGAPGGGPQ